MNNLRILIIGDSFAADWSVKYNEYKGWPNLIAEKFPTVNLAQAGVSEYKIYQQLTGADLTKFDLVIASHTSPLRVPTRRHPIHNSDSLHKAADLMFTDIEYHSTRLKNIFNRSLQSAYNFFIHHYDIEYFETSYKLFREKINQIIGNKPIIVISNLPDMDKFITEKIVLNFYPDGGIINHMTACGNHQVYLSIIETIKKLSTSKQIVEE